MYITDKSENKLKRKCRGLFKVPPEHLLSGIEKEKTMKNFIKDCGFSAGVQDWDMPNTIKGVKQYTYSDVQILKRI
jgi:hypothetical protein